MKIEKVENDKIKVTLTNEDLIMYDISGENVKPDSAELHKFLFEIMESVREETGFNPYNGQVVVEAVQDKSGITLFISKLKTAGTPGAFNIANPFSPSRKKVKKIKINKNIHKSRYIFKSFDTLCEALKLIKTVDLKGCSLYKYENCWYLSVPSGRLHLNSLLGEFCDFFNERVLNEAFLKEHAKLVARDENLISMTKGIKALD